MGGKKGDNADGSEKKKTKELKVLDSKTAQNMCKYLIYHILRLRFESVAFQHFLFCKKGFVVYKKLEVSSGLDSAEKFLLKRFC